MLSRTIKDLVCRYHTMRGEQVTRIAGWDTHGLPVEIEVEKKLGISGKREIEAIGVARFNEVCRESVFTYKEDWERLSERTAYWLDYSKPYVTFMPNYIESVWWILKQFDDKGLLYRGHKSVPYCPRCGTALSSHEVAQGYEDVQDPSLYFIAPILVSDGNDDRRAFLVWTTTPWTLPSNVALAIHPELTYAEVESDGRGLILAEARVQAVFGDDALITHRYQGSELVGMRYARPFDLIPPVAGNDNAWQVLPAEFVSADDGTGIVHLAPAFGADDYAAGQKHGLPMFRPIDDAGKFAEDLDLVGGMFVKDADPVLVADLKARGLVFRSLKEWHSYPHCWRCGTPLIYMARDSWYLRTTSIKDVMLQNNAQVVLASAGSRHGPLWRVARGQRRLGAVARALLGHAAPRVGVRPGQVARACDRIVRRACGTSGAAAGELRSAQAVHRRIHVQVRAMRWHDAAHAGSHRRVVRLGLDAVRAVALPVREQGAVREALSRPTSSARASTRRAAGSTR